MMKLKIFLILFSIFLLLEHFSKYYMEHFGKYLCFIIIVNISSSKVLDITMNATPEMALSIFLSVNMGVFNKDLKIIEVTM